MLLYPHVFFLKFSVRLIAVGSNVYELIYSGLKEGLLNLFALLASASAGT